MLDQRLDRGGEQQSAPGVSVEQWVHAKWVPSAQQDVSPLVPDQQGKDAFYVVKYVFVPVQIRPQDQLGVVRGRRGGSLEAVAQLLAIVEHAIEDYLARPALGSRGWCVCRLIAYQCPPLRLGARSSGAAKTGSTRSLCLGLRPDTVDQRNDPPRRVLLLYELNHEFFPLSLSPTC